MGRETGIGVTWMKNPYVILGAARDASDEELKRAYRRLAKRLHPDVNPGNHAIAQQFRELTAAYELLSDPVQRRRFDNGEIDADGRERGFSSRPPPGARADRPTTSEGLTLDEIFQEFMSRGRKAGARAAAAAKPAEPAAQPLGLSFLEAARGGKRPVALADGRSIEVTVPPGIESGQKLRLRDAKAGEILLEIAIEAHPIFTRQGRDIHIELSVTLAEALLGATITVPTIHGAVALKVPRGSNSGSQLRLRGKGIAAADANGDQYVRLKVLLPDPPDAELTEFVERWAQRHGYKVRDGLDTA
jgi:DnaJ-class molecular chaperone